MQIPEAFARRMVRVHGEAGGAWIEGLPSVLAALAAEWEVEIGPPVPNLTYNYVAPATGRDGRRWVVKLVVGSGEGDREAVAMAAYGGNGAARLARHDPLRRAMLLERVEPGSDLRATNDPEAAQIAAGVLERLWEAPPVAGLADLRGWTAALDRFAERPSPLPREALDRAAGLRRELLVSPPERVIVHGDLHHANILLSDERGWLAIDPKGLIGEKAFDVLFYLLNPGPLPPETTRLRIDTFVERLSLDRERVIAWSYVQSVVLACWTVEDRETGWERAVAFAEEVGKSLGHRGRS